MFSLGIGSIISIAGPVVLKYVGKQLASWVITKIRGEPKEGLEKEIIKAFEKGKVESLIRKYDTFFTEEIKTKLRAIADLRNLFKRAEKALKKEKYTIEAAQDFTNLSRILDDPTVALSFKEAGIEKIKVKDEETGKEIRVTSEDYFVALLLRFAAAVWTQLGMKETPMMDGWALEYEKRLHYKETEVGLEMERDAPRSMTLGRPAKTERIDPDFRRFRVACTTLIAAYRQSMKIRDLYLRGVSCLKTAQLKAKQAQKQQDIHRSMKPNHLEGLILGFRGEAQYWLFNINPDLEDAADTVRSIIERDRRQAAQFLERMDITEDEKEIIKDSIDLTLSISDGFAGAFRLFRQALSKCEEGKDAKMLQKRITALTHRISANPVIHVPDPPPIF